MSELRVRKNEPLGVRFEWLIKNVAHALTHKHEHIYICVCNDFLLDVGDRHRRFYSISQYFIHNVVLTIMTKCLRTVQKGERWRYRCVLSEQRYVKKAYVLGVFSHLCDQADRKEHCWFSRICLFIYLTIGQTDSFRGEGAESVWRKTNCASLWWRNMHRSFGAEWIGKFCGWRRISFREILVLLYSQFHI